MTQPIAITDAKTPQNVRLRTMDMPPPQRKRSLEQATNNRNQEPGESSHRPAEPRPILGTVLYILNQILEVPTTAVLLTFGFLLPDLHDWITSFGMGKDFRPSRDIGSLAGKVILVTGGNAGLGKATVAYLAAHEPSRIYLAARTASKAQSAIADIRSSVPKACEIVHLPLDLTSFSSIAEAADTFKAKERRLDILINNAGVMATPYSTTKEGYEIQLGTNHVGHALLTKLLLPTLLETAKQPDSDVRIISVSSMGHYAAPSEGIVFDQKALENYVTWRRYGVSKLANVLYAKSLAEHYPQITSVSLHPGVILTDLYASLQANPFLKFALWIYGIIGLVLPGHYKNAEGGALTQTWAATVKKDELVNGAFYKPVGVQKAGSKLAQDEALQKRLWEWTQSELERHGY